MSINYFDLISKFQYALDNGFGYIYGASYELWSAAKQAAYAQQWAGNADRANSVKYGGKWAGHYVTDCSGLFAWSFKQLGGSIAHGSNSIWNKYCSSKGTMKSGKRADGQPLLPGTAVFTSTGDKHNHIGLYIGDGYVIEAQGAQTGVVKGKVSASKWTHWGELQGVNYQSTTEEGRGKMKAKVVLPSGAKGDSVNMRAKDSQSATIVTRVPVGATVEITADLEAWCRIEYSGKTGYMMSNYLEYAIEGAEKEASDNTGAEKIDKACSAIEGYVQKILEQIDIIGSINGRG